jgi:signal transduction histidine kinase
MTSRPRNPGQQDGWRSLLIFLLIYIGLHLLLELASQITTMADGVSLWYPVAGLTIAVVLRFRLLGAAMAIIATMVSHLISNDGQFSFLSMLFYAVATAAGALLIRSALRRAGYSDPRAIPRPKMTAVLFLVCLVYSLITTAISQLALQSSAREASLNFNAILNWWLGDFVGATAILNLCFQLLFPMMEGKVRYSRDKIGPWVLCIMGYGSFSLLPWLLSTLDIAGQNYRLVFLAAIPVFYAALRRGMGETSLAIAFANFGFMLASRAVDVNSSAELQTMALMINIGGNFTSAITTNQKAMVRALRRTLDERDRLAAEREVFERRLAESQRLDALGQMAGGLAHEINNLLHPIKSFGRMAMTAADDKRQHYLVRIQECANGAQRIVADVLTFAREAKKSDVADLESVPAQSCIETAIAIAADGVPASITLTQALRLEAAHIRCDAGGMSQVLVNLVNNARDAMPNGGTIDIIGELTTLDAPHAQQVQLPAGRYVELIVRDSGEGISHELLGRVFEPFFTTKDVGRGTGLGLSVVYGMLHRWGGAIRVDSIVGTGTTFTLLIPLASQVTG